MTACMALSIPLRGCRAGARKLQEDQVAGRQTVCSCSSMKSLGQPPCAHSPASAAPAPPAPQTSAAASPAGGWPATHARAPACAVSAYAQTPGLCTWDYSSLLVAGAFCTTRRYIAKYVHRSEKADGPTGSVCTHSVAVKTFRPSSAVSQGRHKPRRQPAGNISRPQRLLQC